MNKSICFYMFVHFWGVRVKERFCVTRSLHSCPNVDASLSRTLTVNCTAAPLLRWQCAFVCVRMSFTEPTMMKRLRRFSLVNPCLTVKLIIAWALNIRCSQLDRSRRDKTQSASFYLKNPYLLPVKINFVWRPGSLLLRTFHLELFFFIPHRRSAKS